MADGAGERLAGRAKDRGPGRMPLARRRPARGAGEPTGDAGQPAPGAGQPASAPGELARGPGEPAEALGEPTGGPASRPTTITARQRSADRQDRERYSDRGLESAATTENGPPSEWRPRSG